MPGPSRTNSVPASKIQQCPSGGCTSFLPRWRQCCCFWTEWIFLTPFATLLPPWPPADFPPKTHLLPGLTANISNGLSPCSCFWPESTLPCIIRPCMVVRWLCGVTANFVSTFFLGTVDTFHHAEYLAGRHVKPYRFPASRCLSGCLNPDHHGLCHKRL